ncbi:MAG: hypothetical protein U0235_01840 [Polyangiaceae bacterium]
MRRRRDEPVRFGGSGTPSTPTPSASASSPRPVTTPTATATATTTPTSTPPSTACVAPLAWGPDGGFGSSTQQSSLTSCTRYTFSRTDSSGTKQCQAMLPTASGISAADVAQALGAPEVQAAFNSAKLFGTDPRPCDGSILRITYGARRLDVGGDCADPGCVPSTGSCLSPPPAVAKLVDLLTRIEAEERKTPACSKL